LPFLISFQKTKTPAFAGVLIFSLNFMLQDQIQCIKHPDDGRIRRRRFRIRVRVFDESKTIGYNFSSFVLDIWQKIAGLSSSKWFLFSDFSRIDDFNRQ